MGGPTTNQSNQTNTSKQSETPNNNTAVSSIEAPSQSNELKSLALPAIEVKIHSNKREDLPYLIFPTTGASNDPSASQFPILVVNGMNMTSESIFNMGQNIANKFGRASLMIPNHTEGKMIDIRNCIVSAFSSRLGVHLESGAAGNLANNLVNRLNDDKPIEIISYSQGTLITSNVLSELKTFLIQGHQKEAWNNFASRIDLKTYGAATHVWPSGIGNITEYRHMGDPIAGIGNYVSAIQMVSKGTKGDFKSEFATQIKLPVFKDAHSIINYLGSSNFYLKELKGLDPQSQASRILDSMNKKVFSSDEYNSIVQAFAQKGLMSTGKVEEKNHAINLSHRLVKGFIENSEACAMLTPETIEILTKSAAQVPIEREKINIATRLFEKSSFK